MTQNNNNDFEQDPDWLPHRGNVKRKRPWKVVLHAKKEKTEKVDKPGRRSFDFDKLFSIIPLGSYRSERDLIKALLDWKAGRGHAGQYWGHSEYDVVVTFKGDVVENFYQEKCS